ncbi:MAG: septum formation initiator family protein [Alphaproteobacteria bacterium]|nr:septum formation initiator family protein [Alphaproteobacteria bacterium]
MKTKRAMMSGALPLFCFALVIYFSYFGIYGQHGLITLVKTKSELELRQAELDDVVLQRERLERRVLLLRSESLDPDLLDEQARAVLGYTAPGEVTVLDRKRVPER